MRSIAVALIWEFWRRSWWWILSAVMLMVCITTITARYGSGSPPEAGTLARIHYRALFHLFLCVAFFSLWSQSLWSQLDKKNNRLGFPAHLYVKPTQTWVFVGWQMLFPAVTIALLYVVEVGCVRILWGITWPLAGPILLLVTALACTQAIFWSMVDSHVWRTFVCLSVLAALQGWQFSRYGPVQGYPNTSSLTEMWAGLTPGGLLTLAPCLAASYILAVLGVSRDRRGDCFGWPGFWGRLGAVMDLLPGRQKPFNSPAAAQFWREWHEKDRLMPAASGLCVVGIILLGIFGITSTLNTMMLFVFMLQIGLAVPFFAGLLVGQCGRKSIIDDFKATLPVSDARLSAMILRPGAVGLLSAWLVCIAGLAFMIGWFFVVGKGDAIPLDSYHAAKRATLELGYVHTALLVAIGVVMVWGAMAVGASLTLMGRPWLVWIFFTTVCSIGPALMVLDILHAINLVPFSIVPIFRSLTWTIGICCLLGTAWAFVAARRRHLIAPKTPFLGLGLWLMLCLSIGWAWIPRDTPHPAFTALAMGLLSLAVAPLATAPLALAWNRHR